MIYSAFPGTGKTFASSKNTSIIDAESSNFQWLDAAGDTNETTKGALKIKNPAWPQNYIEYIIEKSKKQYCINCVSTCCSKRIR